jgi:hypothetical protein
MPPTNLMNQLYIHLNLNIITVLKINAFHLTLVWNLPIPLLLQSLSGLRVWLFKCAWWFILKKMKRSPILKKLGKELQGNRVWGKIESQPGTGLGCCMHTWLTDMCRMFFHLLMVSTKPCGKVTFQLPGHIYWYKVPVHWVDSPWPLNQWDRADIITILVKLKDQVSLTIQFCTFFGWCRGM